MPSRRGYPGGSDGPGYHARGGAHEPGKLTAQAGQGETLGERALAGVRWMGFARVTAETCAFVSSIVLARLIAPDEFGRTAVALFVIAIAGAVSQQGVGSFLVSHQSPSPSHFQAAYTTAVLIGAAGTILTLAFAIVVAPPIFGDGVAGLTVLASPAWLLAGLAAVPVAQLQRRLQFGRLGVTQASASLAGPVAAIALAAAGLNGAALVLGWLLGAAVTAVLATALALPPSPRWHRDETRELLGYGVPASGSSVLYAGTRNVDYLLLAAFLPAFQVGLYMRAFALGWDYQSKISTILLQVAFPVLSRTTDFDEMRRLRARMIRVHTAVLYPLLFGLIAVAPEFVPWMYGAPWAEAAHYAQILAVGGMIAAVGTGTGPLLLAAGRPRALFAYNLVVFVAYVAAVLAVVDAGLTAVCIAVVAVRLVTFVGLQYFVVERQVGIPVLETIRDDVIAAVAGGLPQLLVTWLGVQACTHAGLPVGIAILVPGLLGLGVNALIVRTVFPDTWGDVMRLATRLSDRRALRRTGAQAPRPAA